MAAVVCGLAVAYGEGAQAVWIIVGECVAALHFVDIPRECSCRWVGLCEKSRDVQRGEGFGGCCGIDHLLRWACEKLIREDVDGCVV